MEFKKGIHYSQELEEAVLGACLIEKEAVGRVYGMIEEDYFYFESHKQVWSALKKMYQEGILIDILTLSDYLMRGCAILELGAVNALYFVTRLTNSVVSSVHMEYHAFLIKTMWMEREIMRLTSGGKPDGDVQQQIKKIQDKIQSLQQKATEHDWQDMTQLMVDLYRHQEEMKATKGIGKPSGINTLDRENGGFQDGQLVIVGARPSVGKCLGKGTKIIMFDGGIKKVEDIKAGDLLMGVDSSARKVLSTTMGFDEMYRIDQRNGVTYTVNSSHILSLKRGKTEWKQKHGDILNISAKEFYNKPPYTQKRYKGYMSECLMFEEKPLTIEPYFLGLWLGDGRKSDHRITNKDTEVIEYCQEYAGRIGMVLKQTVKKGTRCYTLAIGKGYRHKTHPCFKKEFFKIGVVGNKNIPECYLFNSKENRLQLLAGIIDSDGHVCKKNGAIEVVQKNKVLLKQIKFLCNTLGYRVSFKEKRATIKTIGYSCSVYRIIISGNTFEIPLRVRRKRNAVKQIKPRNASMTCIKISPAGRSQYFGFELDGDGLFLLEDCTVTHNSALVGGMAIEMAKKNLSIGIVSLEMSNTEIAARLASYDTDTDFNVIYRGLYRDMEETHRLYDKIGASTSTLPIYVSDKTKVNIPEIRAKAEKLKSLHGLDCLMIDYLQLVSAIGGSYNKNRENEIAEMSRGCKIMAKEMNIPVVLLCQLNREVTKRKGHERYPQLSDLRESGSIEQDADIVMFLHRDYMAGIEVDENGNSTEKQADLVVRKWRNGKSNFIIPLDFDPPKMKFSERSMSGSFHVVAQPHYEKEKNDDTPF